MNWCETEGIVWEAPQLLSSGMTAHVWHRFSPSLLFQTYLPHHHMSSVCSFLGQFLPAWKKRDEISCENWSMQDIKVPISIRDSTRSCTPTWEREDRYQIDTPRIIWQVLSTRCALACVSWLLIKWMPPGPDLQLKDLVVTWTTDASTCKPRQLASYLFISHTL